MITVENNGEASIDFFGYSKEDPNAKSHFKGGKDIAPGYFVF
jgi:hypothetical protein